MKNTKSFYFLFIFWFTFFFLNIPWIFYYVRYIQLVFVDKNVRNLRQSVYVISNFIDKIMNYTYFLNHLLGFENLQNRFKCQKSLVISRFGKLHSKLLTLLQFILITLSYFVNFDKSLY